MNSFITSNPSPYQNSEDDGLKRKTIILESTKEYIGFSLSEKEAKINKLNEKVGILNNSTTYLESFLKEKEDLIISLKDKIKVSERDLAYSTFRLSKMMASSKNLKDILNNTKMFGDKQYIGYSEKVSTSKGCFSKFIKVSNQIQS